ncbi:MAG: YqgE/AlgH family protein [Gammaproteobacteria bacterium]|jgi:putative transcriptional regulator
MYHPRPLKDQLTGLLMGITILLVGVFSTHDSSAGPALAPQKGRFLVATNNLAHSSFRQTVILLTHYSERGATGITINRPADVPMNEAFPSVKELSEVKDTLYLGGPVKTNGIFVLMQTKRPHAGMKNITDDIYFTVGLNAVIHGNPKAKDGEETRAYAGFAGWAPGQLDVEIKRGDWIIVETDPSIVFDENPGALWQRLRKSWAGDWI